MQSVPIPLSSGLQSYYISLLFLLFARIISSIIRYYAITFISVEQYVLVYSVILLLMVIIYIIGKSVFYGDKFSIMTELSSMNKLNLSKKIIIFIMMFFTLVSLVISYRFDNSIEQSKLGLLVMSLASIGAIIYAKYLTKEKISFIQILGGILLLCSVFLINKS